MYYAVTTHNSAQHKQKFEFMLCEQMMPQTKLNSQKTPKLTLSIIFLEAYFKIGLMSLQLHFISYALIYPDETFKTTFRSLFCTRDKFPSAFLKGVVKAILISNYKIDLSSITIEEICIHVLDHIRILFTRSRKQSSGRL